MQDFLTRSLLFLIIFFILDKSLILLRNHLPERELDKRLEYIITGKIDANIIILGSSRGARDILASQLSDSLHTSAYNLSYPGSDIFFHEYLLDALVKYGNKIPKILILALDDPSELQEDPTITFRMDRLYPLVKYQCIRNTLIERGNKNRVLSQLFIIHQLTISNFNPRTKKFGSRDTLLSDGTMPISWQSERFDQIFKKRTPDYQRDKETQQKVESFTQILSICRENKIVPLLVFVPNFKDPTPGFIQRIDELSKHSVHLMQYDTTNFIYRNPVYYYDDSHLKLNGALVLTSEISNYIKQNKLLH